MIISGIIYVLFSIVRGLLTLVPDYSWNADSVTLTNFYEAIRLVFYFFPVDVVISIVTIIVAVNTVRIFISLIKTIWQLIPFL
jgi:hypothetical protein